MADWRTAQALLVLLNQVNKMYPGRNKAADGTIGDEAHRNRASDHNPNAQGIVTALDITHDPSHGLGIGKLADMLVNSNDARIKYIIANKRIWELGAWKPYTGSDPHIGHLHISVKAANADITNPWRLTMDKATQVAEVRLNRSYSVAKELGVNINQSEDAIYKAVLEAIASLKQARDISDVRGNLFKNAAKILGLPENTPAEQVVQAIAQSSDKQAIVDELISYLSKLK